MANCPECGSDHIQFVTETVGLNTKNNTTSNVNVDKKINWGRAVVGGLLFGGVGAIIGATTGKNQEIHTGSGSEYSKSFVDTKKYTICLDCGSEWNPQDIYNLFKLLQELNVIEERLDLSKKENRLFLKNFTMFLENEIEPMSNQILTEKEYLAHSLKSYLYNKCYQSIKNKKSIKNIEKKQDKNNFIHSIVFVTQKEIESDKKNLKPLIRPVTNYEIIMFFSSILICLFLKRFDIAILITIVLLLSLFHSIYCKQILKEEKRKQEKLERLEAKVKSEARIKSLEMYELEKIESEKLILKYEETINLKMTEFIEMNKHNLIPT